MTFHLKLFFLFLTFLTGIYVLWPLHDFQIYLSQGDHGKDLYCFKKTMQGALPYRDYSWFYGPLMPYYYSLFNHLFGVSIQSILLGQNLLILFSGIIIFSITATFISPAIAFVCALWYWVFRGSEFFYTYNHSGGILAMLLTVYFLFRYIKQPGWVYVFAGTLSTFLLMLIRLNIGLTSLLAFTTSLFIIDRVKKDQSIKKKGLLYIFFSLITLSLTALIYWFFLYPLPEYAIHQSIPYNKLFRAEEAFSIIHGVSLLWKYIYFIFAANRVKNIFFLILLLSTIRFSFLIFQKKLHKDDQTNILLGVGSLSLFIFFNLHEFIMSGVGYRIYWVAPCFLIILFNILGAPIKAYSSMMTKPLLIGALCLIAVVHVRKQHQGIQFFKTPSHLLNIGENKVYTTQDPAWFQTVKNTTTYIQNNVPKNKAILVMPYDALYLFLSDRDSATRQLMFFEHNNISEDQQRDIIKGLESEGIDWGIISRRSQSQEIGMGTLGITHSVLIGDYLKDKFRIVAQMGDWQKSWDWAGDQGIKIIKRRITGH